MEGRVPVPCSDDVPSDSSHTDLKVPMPSNGQTGQEVPVPNPGQGVPVPNSGQTGRQVPAPNTARSGQPNPQEGPLGGPQVAGDLATDAERSRPPPNTAAQRLPPGGGSGYGAARKCGDADNIEVPGPHGMIRATGIFANLPAGASVNIAGVSHSVVHNYGDGTKSVSTSRTAPVPNRMKITESQAQPEQRHFNMVAQGLSSGDWMKLGRSLGLRNSALDHLWTDHRDFGVQEVLHQMLTKWSQVSYPVTLHSLASALLDVGYGDLADEISKMS